MQYNEYDERNSFEEKPFEPEKTDVTTQQETEASACNDVPVVEKEVSNTAQTAPFSKSGEQKAREYNRYRQYNEYSSRMQTERPVDAAFRPQQTQYDYSVPQYAEPDISKQCKRKKGVIVCIAIVCVMLTLSVGALSVYWLANSRLGNLIGFGISSALGQRSEMILPGGVGPQMTTTAHVQGGVENPPEFNIVSVTPAPIEKIYDDSGREILNASQIYKLVSPSVVNITTKIAADNGLGYTTTAGSGIIFSTDGYIITNAHVIDGGLTVNVQLPGDDTLYPAVIIGSDTKADIAVIKIEAEGLPAAEFGDSDTLSIGDMAVAIGNPTTLDLMGATTQGIISGLNREIVVDENGRSLTLIQTDAAINPGNSGGPLINCYGQVIGINTVGLKSVTYEGLNFAIPSNIVKPIVEELLEFGYVKGYPTIGITGTAVTAFQAEMYGIPLGVIVATVNEASDAYKKGLQPYDIITHINNQSITSVADLNTVKNRFSVGDSITLTINRDGKTFDLTIKLLDELDLT